MQMVPFVILGVFHCFACSCAQVDANLCDEASFGRVGCSLVLLAFQLLSGLATQNSPFVLFDPR